jgi:hypothetical protein
VKLILIRTIDDLRHPNNRTSSQTLKRSTDNQPIISSSSLDKKKLAHQVIFLDAPHKAEKTTKSIIAIYNNGFLPTISDTRPLTGARRVIASVYDFHELMPSGNVGKLTVPTQEYSEGEAPNSSEIWGSAVATIWNQLVCPKIEQMTAHSHIQSS